MMNVVMALHPNHTTFVGRGKAEETKAITLVTVETMTSADWVTASITTQPLQFMDCSQTYFTDC